MKKRKCIYILQGEAGKYSDKMIWIVAAFDDLEKAQEYKALCEKEAAAYYELEGYGHKQDEYKKAMKYDSRFIDDYTGTDYYLYKVAVISKLDTLYDDKFFKSLDFGDLGELEPSFI